MLDEIISDSRHKFIYFDDSKRALVIGECLNSNINLDISMPIYIKDNGLPEDDSLLDLDKYRLIIFHERYFDFLIALSVIDALCMKIGKDILNKKLLRMFNILSYSSKNNISNIDQLRIILEHDKKVYYDGYRKYLATGRMDFVDDLLIGFITLDIFLKNIKRNLGISNGFSLFLDYDDLSVMSMQVINKYINSRCNGYLSINVLCGEKDWKTFYDSNGYFIQNIHDFTEIDYRTVKKKNRHI